MERDEYKSKCEKKIFYVNFSRVEMCCQHHNYEMEDKGMKNKGNIMADTKKKQDINNDQKSKTDEEKGEKP